MKRLNSLSFARKFSIFLLLGALTQLLPLYESYSQSTAERLRVFVLTDIEADPDDSQSLVRFLTYSNEWDTEGIVATTSIHQKNMVAPESVLSIIDAYGKTFDNMKKHAEGYPTPEDLKAKVKQGLPVYGMQGVGGSKDSEGSEWLIQVLEKEDDRPLWVCVWGGSNVLAQALWKIRKTKSKAEAARLVKKLRVYTISDQDDSGPWMRETFPDLFYICTPGYTYGNATWIGIAGKFPGSNQEVVSNEWLAEHIQQGHGPLGASYPDVAYIMEGDTPSFLYLIPNGLNQPDLPNFGGWGGRYEHYIPELQPQPTTRPNWPETEQETRPLWTNTSDSIYLEEKDTSVVSNYATIWRWREEFQNDFSARMDWTVKTFDEANHPPVPALAHNEQLSVQSGEDFYLNAAGTSDPDGDSMSYYWFQYREAGSYPEVDNFAPYASNIYRLRVTAPEVNQEETIHFILKVTDKGTPALTRYKRVIVTVLP